MSKNSLHQHFSHSNDGLSNAVVTSTVRTPGPMSVDISFPRPPLAVVNTDVVLALPSTGVFSGQRYTLAAQAVVQQTPDKNDVQVGESSMSGLGSSLTWRIQSFAEPGLEVDLAPLPASAVVADIVYVPLETRLLAAARARGLIAVDGLGMLLHQARPGFEVWFGVAPQVDQALRDVVAADIPKRDGA